MRRMLILTALCMTTPMAFAQVYKCVDASGRTTYVQSPCPTGTKATTLNMVVPPAPPPAEPAKGDADKAGKAAKASGPKTAAEMEQDFRQRRQEQQKAQEKEEQRLAEVKMREDNCRNSRLQLMNLEAGGRHARVDEKGERSILDESQLEQEKANARKLVQEWCK